MLSLYFLESYIDRKSCFISRYEFRNCIKVRNIEVNYFRSIDENVKIK